MAIEVEGLVVRRGGKEVLHGLGFAVAPGRVTGLLGPSGCGKTTLMRAIVGVQVVESGRVEVLGRAAGTAELRARIGYVTQAPSVYLDLSVRENLSYFARVLGVGHQRIDAVLETVALAEQAEQVVGSLSGGQSARVSLATALLGEPQLLVLDEPTVGLDPVLRRDLWGTFRSFAARGATLLVSSHVMEEAGHCDELLLMRDGDLLASETPGEDGRAGARRRLPRPDRGAGASVSARITGATALRVLTQLRRDPRTIALLLGVPPFLLALLKGAFEQDPASFQHVGGPLVGLFPFSTMFVVTSITMLRERTTGTLERLMSLPLAKLDLLFGYGIAFALVAVVQALVTGAVAFGPLGLDVAGSPAAVVALAVGNALLGMSLGLFVSAFARTEFQAVQFMPAIVFPQLLLCGLFVARDQMAEVLHVASALMPLTYAFEALSNVTTQGSLGSRGALDVSVIVGATLLLLALGAATLRRRTP